MSGSIYELQISAIHGTGYQIAATNKLHVKTKEI
jgi:hypothetical protein